MDLKYLYVLLSLTLFKYEAANASFGASDHDVSIEGKIILTGKKVGKVLAKGSCLVITVEEEIMDSPKPKIVAKDVKYMPVFEENQIKYSLKFKHPQDGPPNFILSANLNIGWCQEKPSEADVGRWIKKGDFLADTNVNVNFDDGHKLVDKDVTLIYYKK